MKAAISPKIKKFFDIQELVCKHIYDKYGQMAWDFLDNDLLEVLVFIREGLGKAIFVNSWSIGGTASQRGLRCQHCEMVKSKAATKPYMSAHCFGKAVDFDVKGMTAQDVRDWIIANASKLPHPIRLEDGVSWVHIDVRNDDPNKMVKLFNA